jgi:hypothetical protein
VVNALVTVLLGFVHVCLKEVRGMKIEKKGWRANNGGWRKGRSEERF